MLHGATTIMRVKVMRQELLKLQQRQMAFRATALQVADAAETACPELLPRLKEILWGSCRECLPLSWDTRAEDIGLHSLVRN